MAVCLHCLHSERLAARDRRQRIIVRIIAWTLSIAIVAVVGAAGVNAATKHETTPSTPRVATRRPVHQAPATRNSTPVVATAATAIQQQGTPTAPAARMDSSLQPTPPALAPAPALPTPVVRADSTPLSSSLIGPIIPQGRTDLQDSLYAVRRGDTVVVNFDTGPARTRRADKFEFVVRQTLKNVFGSVADTLLSAVPEGKLVNTSELVTTLPQSGIRLQGSHGPRVALWPQTKPGRNGPLVFAYKTVVQR